MSRRRGQGKQSRSPPGWGRMCKHFPGTLPRPLLHDLPLTSIYPSTCYCCVFNVTRTYSLDGCLYCMACFFLVDGLVVRRHVHTLSHSHTARYIDRRGTGLVFGHRIGSSLVTEFAGFACSAVVMSCEMMLCVMLLS